MYFVRRHTESRSAHAKNDEARVATEIRRTKDASLALLRRSPPDILRDVAVRRLVVDGDAG